MLRYFFCVAFCSFRFWVLHSVDRCCLYSFSSGFFISFSDRLYSLFPQLACSFLHLLSESDIKNVRWIRWFVAISACWSIHKGSLSDLFHSNILVNVTKEVVIRMDTLLNFTQQGGISTKMSRGGFVPNTVRWSVRHQYVSVIRYSEPAILALLSTFQWESPAAELRCVRWAINLDARVKNDTLIPQQCDVCHISNIFGWITLAVAVEPLPKLIVLLNVKANIVVASDSNLNWVRLLSEPLVDRFNLFRSPDICHVSAVK